jgi:hypothetical protein
VFTWTLHDGGIRLLFAGGKWAGARREGRIQSYGLVYARISEVQVVLGGGETLMRARNSLWGGVHKRRQLQG